MQTLTRITQGHYIKQPTGFIQGVMNKDSMGAFIINGKKTHPKSCYSKGWKQSILWLREHIDPKAEVFITKGKHKYIYPMTKAMRARVDILAKPYPCGNSSAVEQPSILTGEGGATPTCRSNHESEVNSIGAG